MQYGIFWLVLALVAGAMMPTQAAINHKLALYVQHPVLSAFISFGVGTVALLGYILLTGIPISQLTLAKNAPRHRMDRWFIGCIFCSVRSHAGAAPGCGTHV